MIKKLYKQARAFYTNGGIHPDEIQEVEAQWPELPKLLQRWEPKCPSISVGTFVRLSWAVMALLIGGSFLTLLILCMS